MFLFYGFSDLISKAIIPCLPGKRRKTFNISLDKGKKRQIK